MSRKKYSSVRRQTGSVGRGFWTFVMLAGPVALIFHATAIVLLVGMLPTIVAYFMDRQQPKLAPITVGAINICGVLPFLIALWSKNHSIVGAMKIIGDPVAWLVMYAAAGAGWGIYYGVPPAVANVQILRAEMRRDALRKEHVELVAEWGPDVAGEDHDIMDFAGAPPSGDMHAPAGETLEENV